MSRLGRTGVPKAQRRRLARAELIVILAWKAGDWAADVGDRDRKTIPFDQWPKDDAFREIAESYDLSGSDLAKILDKLADDLEWRAERAGFSEAWR